MSIRALSIESIEHVLVCAVLMSQVKQSVDQTQFGTATIVRVLDGQVAIASDGTKYEVLMPGLHVRNSPTFKFYGKFKQTDEVISVGPINMFLVPSGSVRACYTGGVLDVFEPGTVHPLRKTDANHCDCLFVL
jgi:hypothetical protein